MKNRMDGMLLRVGRNELITLIREVGRMWGEEPEDLEDYVVEQVKMWSNNLDDLNQAIRCFKNLKAVGRPKVPHETLKEQKNVQKDVPHEPIHGQPMGEEGKSLPR